MINCCLLNPWCLITRAHGRCRAGFVPPRFGWQHFYQWHPVWPARVSYLSSYITFPRFADWTCKRALIRPSRSARSHRIGATSFADVHLMASLSRIYWFDRSGQYLTAWKASTTIEASCFTQTLFVQAPTQRFETILSKERLPVKYRCGNSPVTRFSY